MSPQAFSAKADTATSTVHAHGYLDRLTVDLLWATIDVLLRADRYNLTPDVSVTPASTMPK
jgi:hypothetical protein